jgi:RimJ/RimL family protein N-acetyltransferase
MHFSLRTLLPSDAGSIAFHANNYQVTRNLTSRFPYPYTEDHAMQFLQQLDPGDMVQGIEVLGEVVGVVGLHLQKAEYCKNAELGYWLGEAYWGKGMASRAARMMVVRGFQEMDIARIYARIYASNLASQKVAERAGLALEARFEGILFREDAFEDELIFGIRRGNG